jgi:hypothetical protein
MVERSFGWFVGSFVKWLICLIHTIALSNFDVEYKLTNEQINQ